MQVDNFRLSKNKTIIYTLSCFVLCICIWFVADLWQQNQLIKEKKLDLLHDLQIHGNALDLAANKRFALLQGLKAFVLSDLNSDLKIDQDRFTMFVSTFLNNTEGIRNMIIAPDGVNKYVFPIKGNEAAVGHDLLKDERPNVQADIKEAINSGSITLSGPYELRQGGLGVVARLAVFKNDIFWGFVTMVLDIPPILTESKLGDSKDNHNFAVFNDDNFVFYGDKIILNKDPVIVTVKLPDGHWYLAATPLEGWEKFISQKRVYFRIYELLLIILITFVVYLISSKQTSLLLQIKKKTQEIQGEIDAHKKASDLLTLSEEKYKMLFTSVPSGLAYHKIILDSNKTPIDYTFLNVNETFEEITGLKKEDLIDNKVTDIFPGIENAQPNLIHFYGNAALTGEKDSLEFYFTPLEKWFNVTVSSPDIEYFIVSFQDITKQKNIENQLLHLISQKEYLMKELQHRVKNNLNVVSGFLGMEIKYLPDDKTRQIFNNARNRINSMASIYERLYNSDDLQSVELHLYIKDLAENIFETYNINPNRIALITNLSEIMIDSKIAIPLGLILNELISNALKYAFPENQHGEIFISLVKKKDRVIFIVEDNGIGLLQDFNFETTESMGMLLVKMLSQQIDGIVSINGDTGTKVSINFKNKDI